MRIFLLSFTLLLFSCSSNFITNKKKQYSIKLNVQSKTLSNGLKLIIIKNSKLPIFSYYTFFKVGSIYETPGITGASHFLEHMMFKGAKKYAQGEFDKIIELLANNMEPANRAMFKQFDRQRQKEFCMHALDKGMITWEIKRSEPVNIMSLIK